MLFRNFSYRRNWAIFSITLFGWAPTQRKIEVKLWLTLSPRFQWRLFSSQHFCGLCDRGEKFLVRSISHSEEENIKIKKNWQIICDWQSRNLRQLNKVWQSIEFLSALNASLSGFNSFHSENTAGDQHLKYNFKRWFRLHLWTYKKLSIIDLAVTVNVNGVDHHLDLAAS